MGKKNSHCSYCGHPFMENQPWPRTCGNCNAISFVNPIPVAVALLPVDDGLLVIRRSIEPHRGKLALPGGYVDLGESWQQAVARELFEETGITIHPDKVSDFKVLSTPEGNVLIFGLVEKVTEASLPPFMENSEATERMILREPQDLAFPLHTQAMREFFARFSKSV